MEAIAGPRFDWEVMVETMVGAMLEMVGSLRVEPSSMLEMVGNLRGEPSSRLEMVGSLRGEPSSGGETILTFGFVL